MTMVRPCRLITRQRSHMGFTDGRTFMDGLRLAVAVGDPAAGEVVGGELDLDAVARGDADVVLAHLPGDGGQDGMPAVELHPKHRARECLDDLALDLDFLFLDWQPTSQLTRFRRAAAQSAARARAVRIAKRALYRR